MKISLIHINLSFPLQGFVKLTSSDPDITMILCQCNHLLWLCISAISRPRHWINHLPTTTTFTKTIVLKRRKKPNTPFTKTTSVETKPVPVQTVSKVPSLPNVHNAILPHHDKFESSSSFPYSHSIEKSSIKLLPTNHNSPRLNQTFHRNQSSDWKLAFLSNPRDLRRTIHKLHLSTANLKYKSKKINKNSSKKPTKNHRPKSQTASMEHKT